MLALLLLACVSSGPQLPQTEASSGAFRVTLDVYGELGAKDSVSIKCPEFSSRPEIAWMIDEGTRVKKGDPVIEFDRVAMERGLVTAEAELELAQTKIEQNAAKLELRVAEMQASIDRAKLDLEMARMRRTNSETVPLVEREDARVNETKASMAIDGAEGALSTSKLDARAETQLLALEVAKRSEELDDYRDQLEKAVLTAPEDGLVLVGSNWQGKWKVGSRPWTGAKLIELPNLASMQVTAQVHEIDSPRVAVGQPARVVMEAHPDLPVQGKVEKVADLAVAKGDDDIKFLEVTVALDETLPEMKPGMTVRVELELERHEDAVWVPIEAVFPEGEEKVVWTSGITGWKATTVETGVENDTHVMVEGLEAGTTIALVNPSSDERPAGKP